MEPATLIEVWRAKAGQEEPELDEKGKQKAWDIPLARKCLEELKRDSDQNSLVRLRAACSPDSGAWLGAIPTPTLGTQLDPDTLRIALSLRLGSRVCEPHICKCGTNVDPLGCHLLSCRFDPGRHPRHTSLNDIIHRALSKAGVPAVLEPPGLDRGDGKRLDGISLVPFKNGISLCWDCTCTNTFAESHLNDSALTTGYAATRAESAKRAKYPDLCRRFNFQPIAFETTGVIGPSSALFIKELGARIRLVSGDARETYWLKQRLGLAIQRGNSAAVMVSVRRLVRDTA